MQTNTTALATRSGSLEKMRARLFGGEIAGAQGTTEYVVVVGVAVAIGVLIFAFKDVIGTGINTMKDHLTALFTGI